MEQWRVESLVRSWDVGGAGVGFIEFRPRALDLKCTQFLPLPRMQKTKAL